MQEVRRSTWRCPGRGLDQRASSSFLGWAPGLWAALWLWPAGGLPPWQRQGGRVLRPRQRGGGAAALLCHHKSRGGRREVERSCWCAGCGRRRAGGGAGGSGRSLQACAAQEQALDQLQAQRQHLLRERGEAAEGGSLRAVGWQGSTGALSRVGGRTERRGGGASASGRADSGLGGRAPRAGPHLPAPTHRRCLVARIGLEHRCNGHCLDEVEAQPAGNGSHVVGHKERRRQRLQHLQHVGAAAAGGAAEQLQGGGGEGGAAVGCCLLTLRWAGRRRATASQGLSRWLDAASDAVTSAQEERRGGGVARACGLA